MLRDWLSQYLTNEWLLVGFFIVIFGGILFLIDLPFSFYQRYVLPHRFDLSNQKIPAWIIDEFKGILVRGIIGLILLEMVYAILRAYPTYWWLWAAGILFLFNVLLANIAPILIMPLFNKFVPVGDEHAELADRLMRLAKRSGF